MEPAPNQLLFNGDTTPTGKVTQGLSTTCADSFIDNYGKIIRSNNGTFDTGLPIKNETSASGWTATLDVQSNLRVSGYSTDKTAGYGVDQVGGNTILENGSTLTVAGFFMSAGDLLTYETANATIAFPTGSGYSGRLVTVTGGTMQFSADNTAQYGSLTVAGTMTWTGGTFQDYVNGVTAQTESQLIMQDLLTLGAGRISA